MKRIVSIDITRGIVIIYGTGPCPGPDACKFYYANSTTLTINYKKN